MFFVLPYREIYILHLSPSDLLVSIIQRRLSFWFKDRTKKISMLWYTGSKSNLLLSYISLFHYVACNVVLFFSPSMRLISFRWKMSLLWVTMMVIVPCMYLPTTTLIRSSRSPTTSKLLGVHYGRRLMRSLTPCPKMTPTLLTLLARCSMCGRGTINWRFGGGTIINIILWICIGKSLLIVMLSTREIARLSSLMT